MGSIRVKAGSAATRRKLNTPWWCYGLAGSSLLATSKGSRGQGVVPPFPGRRI